MNIGESELVERIEDLRTGSTVGGNYLERDQEVTSLPGGSFEGAPMCHVLISN